MKMLLCGTGASRNYFLIIMTMSLFSMAACDAGEESRWSRYVEGGSFLGANPSMSSDGKLIVYASPRSGHGDIYVTQLDRLMTRRVTSDGNYEGFPKFSPDGKAIAFSREDHGIGHIWIMNADGSGSRQLTQGQEDDFGPSFSPDASRIVFSRRVNAAGLRPGSAASVEVLTMTIDGRDVRRLTNNRKPDWEASFSPDGQRILFSRGSQFFLTMALDGTQEVQIGKGASPAYSPDGKKVIFISGEYGGREISIMNSDGTDVQLLYTSKTYKSYPTFCPDGHHIMFLDEFEARGIGIIKLLNLKDKAIQIVTKTD
jgi:TolB protein